MWSPLLLEATDAGPWWRSGRMGGRMDGDRGVRRGDNWLTLSSL